MSVIGGFQHPAVLTVEHEVFLVTRRHGCNFIVHGTIEHLCDRNIERQSDN
jgi:hypothetical protein